MLLFQAVEQKVEELARQRKETEAEEQRKVAQPRTVL